MEASKRERDRRQDPPPPGSRWLPFALTFLIGILAGLIVNLFGPELYRAVFGEDEPPVRGAIERPLRAATVRPGSVVAGSLVGVPDDTHVWLLARREGSLWPVGSELAHEPSWERRIPTLLPRGEPLSLHLVTVGDEGADALRSRLGRIRGMPAAELGDLEELAGVTRFFVEVEARGPRLYAVFPQARGSRGDAFRYENGGGIVAAELPDDASCHRPSRPLGLRLEWRMSGEQSGGWGVAWDGSSTGSFDASRFARLSFTVKGAAGGETFELALKDTAGRERRVESVTAGDVSASEWHELSVPLSAFDPVDLGALENLSVGFSQPDGSGEVCIDAIAFVGAADGEAETAALPGAGGDVEAARFAALRPQRLALEGESARGGGEVMSRGNASNDATLLLRSGESAALRFLSSGAAFYLLRVRYSNDNFGPLETVRLALDRAPVGELAPRDTGDWNRFAGSHPLGPVQIGGGQHRLRIAVSGGDGYGVEIDRVRLLPAG